MRESKVVMTLDLVIMLVISSAIMFISGTASVLLTDFEWWHPLLLTAPFTAFYASRKRILIFPCYLIIDAHFAHWLHVFFSDYSLIWPSSIVFAAYFGSRIFKRKSNFVELCQQSKP